MTQQITFSEAFKALKQVAIKIKNTHNNSTILIHNDQPKQSKRIFHADKNKQRKKANIEDIKARTKCMACGKTSLSFTYNPECLKKILEKLAESKSKKEDETTETPTKSLFPQGVSEKT